MEKIIYEDNHIIAVNKVAGIPTVPDISGDLSVFEILKGYIKDKYQKKGNVYLGIVHRIDRPVSGIVVFARTSKAASRLSEQIREKKIIKKYLAIVEETPYNDMGIIESYIMKDSKSNIVKVYNNKINDSAKLSLTHWKLLKTITSEYGVLNLLEVVPETGRSHQIRAQLSSSGFPVLGDKKYKSRRDYFAGKIALHSYSFTFNHPTKYERLSLTAPPPKNHIWNMFEIDT